MSQWAAFVNMCTVATTTSRFPILVGGFSRLLMGKSRRMEPQDLLATSLNEIVVPLLELAI